MLAAERVIEAARDRHPAFDRSRTPDPSVLRFLSQYRKELAGKVAAIDETALIVSVAVPMPLADHEAGITLPANRYIAGVVAKDNRTPASYLPIDLVPWAMRNDINTPVAAAWEYGGKLYLRSPAARWSDITEIGVSIVPSMETDLSALDDDVGLPTEAERALTEACAFFMAKRDHNDPVLPAIDKGAFAAAATQAESEYLTDVMNRNTGRHFRTRDVNYYGTR